jgi:hypothetical protein
MDRIYRSVVTRRLRAMGIRDKPIAPASRWQNGFVERLIGSIRRECVDHIIVLGEVHLRRVLQSYAAIITTSERIGHWTRTRRFLARFSGPEASVHPRYLVDFAITASGFRFTVHTGNCRSTVLEFYDLLSVCCFRSPLLGSSYPPCDSNTPRSARVPHRSGSLRQSRASAARAKPEPSANLGSARANRQR